LFLLTGLNYSDLLFKSIYKKFVPWLVCVVAPAWCLAPVWLLLVVWALWLHGAN